MRTGRDPTYSFESAAGNPLGSLALLTVFLPKNGASPAFPKPRTRVKVRICFQRQWLSFQFHEFCVTMQQHKSCAYSAWEGKGEIVELKKILFKNPGDVVFY